jgi:hypothetical protein
VEQKNRYSEDAEIARYMTQPIHVFLDAVADEDQSVDTMASGFSDNVAQHPTNLC